jgi:hypothetical protein
MSRSLVGSSATARRPAEHQPSHQRAGLLSSRQPPTMRVSCRRGRGTAWPSPRQGPPRPRNVTASTAGRRAGGQAVVTALLVEGHELEGRRALDGSRVGPSMPASRRRNVVLPPLFGPRRPAVAQAGMPIRRSRSRTTPARRSFGQPSVTSRLPVRRSVPESRRWRGAIARRGRPARPAAGPFHRCAPALRVRAFAFRESQSISPRTRLRSDSGRRPGRPAARPSPPGTRCSGPSRRKSPAG